MQHLISSILTDKQYKAILQEFKQEMNHSL